MKARYFVLATLLASFASQDAMAGGRNPGSVLVYPVHRSGAGMFTVIAVTNSNLRPATPQSLGGSTNVHFEYANVIPDGGLPQDPFSPQGCVIFDRIEFLTPADTFAVLTACHNATAAPVTEGYVVVSAEDPSLYRTRWSHNYLMGSSLVVNAAGGVYSTNAIPFESPVAEGNPTDLNSNTRIDFDGKEYEGVPDILYIDSFVALVESSLALINLTGEPTDTNRVLFSAWNDNEFPLSATLDFKCWFDQPLTRVNPLFDQAFLARLPNDPGELIVRCLNPRPEDQFETGWAIIQSIGVRTPGGTRLSGDGAILGAITTGVQPVPQIDGGRLLWESKAKQTNGVFGY